MPIAGTLAELHQWLGGIHPALLVAVAALAVSLETSLFIGLIVPGDVLLLVAGTQASTPGRFAGILAAGVVGSLLGESIGYVLGRRYGTRLRDGGIGRRIGVDRWDAAAHRLRANGARAIVVARFTPVVHALLPVLAGAARVPYRRFIGWCAVAAVGWSAIYVSAGAFAGAHLDRVQGSFGLLGYVALASLFGVVAANGLRRRAAARRTAAENSVGAAGAAAGAEVGTAGDGETGEGPVVTTGTMVPPSTRQLVTAGGGR